MNQEEYVPIYLNISQCVGCTACMQRCPTEAIRIRGGKAAVMRERCVACGECIRVCPHHAMEARVDRLDQVLGKYKYTIALPAQALYGQFPGIKTRSPVLEGLRRMGFDEVFEVATAAEVVSAATHYELAHGSIPHPILTTVCPVVLRLVRIRFPSLLPHLLNYRSPMEMAARWSRQLASRKTGLAPEDIGCVYISPCPAKCASIQDSIGTLKTALNGIVSVAEVAPRLQAVMDGIEDEESFPHSGAAGVGWAIAGGQAAAVGESNNVVASGMENLIRILEALEDGKLSSVELVELSACTPGCVGGALTVENPFIAAARLRKMMQGFGPSVPVSDCPVEDMRWEKTPAPSQVLRLDEDLSRAMEKMDRIRALADSLPGMNCGACGAPSCKAFAEDAVTGRGHGARCVFRPDTPEHEVL